MADYTPLETVVLELLLRGENNVLNVLREQFMFSSIARREFTGAGFYLYFDIPIHISRLGNNLQVSSNFNFGDVKAFVEPTKQELGFLLWIKDGAMHVLEGYTYDNNWPMHITNYDLSYLDGEERDWTYLYGQWNLKN